METFKNNKTMIRDISKKIIVNLVIVVVTDTIIQTKKQNGKKV